MPVVEETWDVRGTDLLEEAYKEGVEHPSAL